MACVAPNGGGMASGSMPLFSNDLALNTVLGVSLPEVAPDCEGVALPRRVDFSAPVKETYLKLLLFWHLNIIYNKT